MVFVHWVEKQYEDVKGNAKWAILGLLWAPMVAAMKSLLQYFTHLPSWGDWTVIALLSAIAFVWVARWHNQGNIQLTQNSLLHKGLPGDSPTFSFDKFFALAHTSQLSEEMEQRMKLWASQQYPNDQVNTLAKFIGIGYWGYMHEITWAYMFKSQLLMLIELNSHSGIIPLSNAKVFYDQAALSYPDSYSSYPFND